MRIYKDIWNDLKMDFKEMFLLIFCMINYVDFESVIGFGFWYCLKVFIVMKRE